MNDLLNALGAGSYAAHSICLTNDALLIGLYAALNGLVFISYATIAAVTLVTRGRVVGSGFGGFSAFIGLCGLTHLSSVLVLYLGVYRLDVMILALTAGVSASTALFVAWSARKWRRKTSPFSSRFSP
jgi:hypothetical protein